MNENVPYKETWIDGCGGFIEDGIERDMAIQINDWKKPGFTSLPKSCAVCGRKLRIPFTWIVLTLPVPHDWFVCPGECSQKLLDRTLFELN